jgi:glutathione peroxidase-family protein
MSRGIFQFTVRDTMGRPFPLSTLAGRARATVVINTASRCGLTTSNMTALGSLIPALGAGASRGGVQFLLFPCDDFGRQEPLSACAVADWAQDALSSAGVNVRTVPPSKPSVLQTFLGGGAGGGVDVYAFDKVHLKARTGQVVEPLFAYLSDAHGAAGWNFTKYVCDADGIPLERVPHSASPMQLSDAIARATRR